ncbi:MAG: Mur ligase family protein [Patescibacteria group bacterium]
MLPLLKKIISAVLTWEARMVIAKYHPVIIAVTGSVGKTSTKDAIFTVLSPSFFVRKSEKSFNSDIGVPLTILGLENGWYDPIAWLKNMFKGLDLIFFPHHYPRILVLEVGADRPGDIKAIAEWLSPDIVVLTRFPDVPAHVEFFSSPDEVIAEKGYLVKSLKEKGLLVFNSDDEKTASLRSLTKAPGMSYGFNQGNNVQASYADIIYEERIPKGMVFRVNYQGKSAPVRLKGVLGRQQIYSTLAALAVGFSQGLNIVKAAETFEKALFAPGRMRIIEGMNNSLVIDDTYNSSPVALKEALFTLQTISVSGRKIAVLADMLELGKYSIVEHRNAGKMAAVMCDTLVSVGTRARMMDIGAEGKRMGKRKRLQFQTSTEAGAYLKTVLARGDMVLVKGSQSMRMEKVVEALMAHPEQKEKLLVRQEREWQRK